MTFLFSEPKFRVILKQNFLSLLVVSTFLGWPFQAHCKPKAKLNTQVFEAESDQQTFSGKVKIVRDIGETEVFFESSKNPGPYILPESLPSYGLYKARLEKSKKSGGPTLKVVVDNDRIKSVEIDESAKPSSTSEKDVIDSLFKK